MSKTQSLSLEAATQAAVALGVPQEVAVDGTRAAVEAGNQPTRHYHTIAHFAELLAGSAEIVSALTRCGIPQETAQRMAHIYSIVARDHDVVYLGADGGRIPEAIRRKISAYVQSTDDSSKNDGLSKMQQENLRIAKQAFGYTDNIVPSMQKNEFLSCLYSLEVNPGILLKDKLALAALHYATIPFAVPDSINQIAGRIAVIQNKGKPVLSPEEVHAVGLAAAHFANRDIAGFAADAVIFQNNGKNLARESGVDVDDPDSIAANIQFYQSLLDKSTSGGLAIFRNYTFKTASDEAVSLLSPEELDRLNSTASKQLAVEITRLNAHRGQTVVVSST